MLLEVQVQSHVKRILIVVLFLFGAAEISTAQSLSATIKKMSLEADVIVTGKVVQNESFWNDGKTKIYTRSSLQVNEYLKGSDAKSSVDVLCPGGEVGGVGELYTHMPTLKKNEEVLLFLKKEQTGSSYKVFNGEDGKIPVLKDVASGQMVASTRMFINALKEQLKATMNENK
jgi:hypothetical protein